MSSWSPLLLIDDTALSTAADHIYPSMWGYVGLLYALYNAQLYGALSYIYYLIPRIPRLELNLYTIVVVAT